MWFFLQLTGRCRPLQDALNEAFAALTARTRTNKPDDIFGRKMEWLLLDAGYIHVQTDMLVASSNEYSLKGTRYVLNCCIVLSFACDMCRDILWVVVLLQAMDPVRFMPGVRHGIYTKQQIEDARAELRSVFSNDKSACEFKCRFFVFWWSDFRHSFAVQYAAAVDELPHDRNR